MPADVHFRKFAETGSQAFDPMVTKRASRRACGSLALWPRPVELTRGSKWPVSRRFADRLVAEEVTTDLLSPSWVIAGFVDRALDEVSPPVDISLPRHGSRSITTSTRQDAFMSS